VEYEVSCSPPSRADVRMNAAISICLRGILLRPIVLRHTFTLTCNNMIHILLVEKSNVVVYAVVGSVIISTLGIISLVTGALIIKRKKETEKMRKQQV